MPARAVAALLFLTASILAAYHTPAALMRGGPAAAENSLGIRMLTIPAGSFQMGSADGEWDERPVQKVTISRSFRMSTTEVTNAQYEQFDPSHKSIRGKFGLSKDGDEAVVFVSWGDAAAFCAWLSKKEGKPYRLPTEAEWEYACRAGTTTAYATGGTLPQDHYPNQSKDDREGWGATPVPTHVGQKPPNAWGLLDMHGNVEEWCHDGYGPYGAAAQIDPVGYLNEDIKVTRGGSHSTPVVYLRSSNRAGAIPTDRHWLLGFRIVQGSPPATAPQRLPWKAAWQDKVTQQKYRWKELSTVAYFEGPIPYVHIAENSNGPLYSTHNHCPAVSWCDNGDLLAAWFSTNRESGREMTIAASRLKAGARDWTPAEEFFKVPDRNMTGTALLHHDSGALYHINGVGASQGYRVNLALVLRISRDNGVTWSQPRFINPERNDPQRLNQPIASIFRMSNGAIVLPSDESERTVDSPFGAGTALWMSRDGGKAWRISDGTIAGIHAGVVELQGGSLLAFGRSKMRSGPDDRLPMSVSRDAGRTWDYAASEFPAIDGGQRLVLMRLREGPILLGSFTDTRTAAKDKPRGMTFKAADGAVFTGYGLYAALSFDEGQTWPVRKLVTAGSPARELDGRGWTHSFVMDANHAEPAGYLTASQTPDGVIHLLSSGLHYRFNLAWLKEPNRFR